MTEKEWDNNIDGRVVYVKRSESALADRLLVDLHVDGKVYPVILLVDYAQTGKQETPAHYAPYVPSATVPLGE